MRWTVHGEKAVYDSEWMRLVLADVELPDGVRFDHHVVRFPREASGTVVHDLERGLLLLWRHRFITDTWGWEIPAGGVDDDETPRQAAERETIEETGWRPGPLRLLTAYSPSNGATDQVFNLFVADGATYIGPPTDVFESERIEWVPLDKARRLIAEGRVQDGLSLTALLWFFAFETVEAEAVEAEAVEAEAVEAPES